MFGLDWSRGRKAVARGWPSKVNLDGNTASHRALRLLRQQNSRWQSGLVCSRMRQFSFGRVDSRPMHQNSAGQKLTETITY